jgi:hypothetical protein
MPVKVRLLAVPVVGCLLDALRVEITFLSLELFLVDLSARIAFLENIHRRSVPTVVAGITAR